MTMAMARSAAMTASVSTTVLQTYQVRVIPVIRPVILRKKYVIPVILD